MLDMFLMALGAAIMFFGVVVLATRRVTPPDGYVLDVVSFSRCLGIYMLLMGGVLVGGTLLLMFIPEIPEYIGIIRIVLFIVLLISMIIHSGRYIHRKGE